MRLPCLTLHFGRSSNRAFSAQLKTALGQFLGKEPLNSRIVRLTNSPPQIAQKDATKNDHKPILFIIILTMWSFFKYLITANLSKSAAPILPHLTLRRGLALILAFLLALGMEPQAHAATYVVQYAGPASLLNAIYWTNKAPGPDTIVFASDLDDTIKLLKTPLPPITGNLTISVSPSRHITLIGNGYQRIFTVTRGATLTLTGLTFTKAGIFATLSDPGGGAICNRGTLTINDSSFSDNSTYSGSGGAIYNTGTLSINNSTFSGNRADTGGNGGAIYNSGTLTVKSSTFSANRADTGGSGGAIYNSGTAHVLDSTFSGNSSRGGVGGALYLKAGTFTLANSIVAGNNASVGPDIYGVVDVGDTNLVQNTEGATLAGTHNILGQDPLLGPLANNGGEVETFALRPGSPAIDSGNSNLPSDGQGRARAVDGNGDGVTLPDRGAFELDRAQSGPNFVVNTLGDHNDGICGISDCSLADAFEVANANSDTSIIRFDPVVFAHKQTMTIDNAYLRRITTHLSIIGPNTPGAGLTLYTRKYSDIFDVSDGTVSISYFTLTLKVGEGIGVFGSTARVTVNSCTFIDNNRAISNEGDLTVNNCTFLSSPGGRNTGIESANDHIMDEHNPPPAVTVNSCTFVNNEYGLIIRNGTMTVNNSIILAACKPIFSIQVHTIVLCSATK